MTTRQISLVDPTQNPTLGARGDYYFLKKANLVWIYVKKDAGITTNWELLTKIELKNLASLTLAI